jgi:hypothetical protein
MSIIRAAGSARRAPFFTKEEMRMRRLEQNFLGMIAAFHATGFPRQSPRGQGFALRRFRGALRRSWERLSFFRRI